MRKKIIIIFVVVFAVGILSGLFIPRLLYKRNLPSSPTDFLSNYLSLSESQKRELEFLNKPFYARVVKIRSQLIQRRAELTELLGESSPNRENISDKVSKIIFLQAQLQRETMNHLLEIRSVLTPEQHKKFLSLVRQGLHPRGPYNTHGSRNFGH